MGLSPVSQERRSDPLGYFRKILATYFADNTWDDTLKLWRIAIANDNADDILWTLDWIVAHPPENLTQLLREDGWITLEHPGQTAGSDGPAFTLDEQVAWLREKVAAFHAEHERAKREA